MRKLIYILIRKLRSNLKPKGLLRSSHSLAGLIAFQHSLSALPSSPACKAISITRNTLVIILLLLGGMTFNVLSQQPTEEWVRRYSVAGNCGLRGMCLDQFGNSYLTGQYQINNWDIVTIKYNSDGVQQWVNTYNDNTLTMDESTGITVDSQGNVFVIGISWNNFTPVYYLLMKYNTDGILQWLKKFNCSTMGSPNGITHDSNGNIYVAANYETTGVAAKYNTNGDSLWVKRYSENNRETYFGKVLTNDSNIYIMGSIYQSFPLNSDFVTLKYDSEGNFKWATKYLGPQPFALDQVKDIDIDDFGNTFVTGIASSGSPTFDDIVTLKYNWNGAQQWEKIFSGPAINYSDDSPKAIKTDHSGNAIITGFSKWSNGQGDINYTTIKYDSNGDTAWTRIYNGQANNSDIAYSLDVDDSDNVYITGSSSNIGTDGDFVTIKYNKTGQQKWQTVYDGFHGYDAGQFIKIDNNSNVILSGISINNWADILALKYSQIVGINTVNTEVPIKFKLIQNYPNPFNPSTEIKYELPQSSYVTLKIYNAIGEEVSRLVNNEFKDAGRYSVKFDGSNLASGIYFYSIEAGAYKDVKKMVLIK